jgi:hypothetical protein
MRTSRPLEDRPCCIKCHNQMSRNKGAFRCRSCTRCTTVAHKISRVVSTNPCCVRCKRQMCFSNPTPRKRAFQCTNCLTTVAAHSTFHGNISALPWCIYCRRMMHRAYGSLLPGGGDTGAFKCGHCRAYTLEHPLRYKPRPSWRAARIMRLVERSMPDGLDMEVYQEARAALLCDLLAGELKQKSLDSVTVRRYVSRARVTQYMDVSLDAVLPSGNRRVDLLVG